MNRQTAASVQLLSLLALLACLSSADKACDAPKNIDSGAHGSCMCQTNNGVIDLNPLANKNGKPRFNVTATNDGYAYTYNPCVKFKDLHPCVSVFICQSKWETTKSSSDVYVIGDSGEQIYQDQNSKNYYVKYAGTTQRAGRVDLICDQSTEGMINTTVTQDKKSLSTYTLQLHSCHACPGGCSSVQPGAIGLAFIFLIPVVFVIYFVVGALVMKYHYQATGTDIIPNKTFWLAIPFLIKDGCVFTFSPCVKLVTSRRNDYQNI